MPRLASDRKDEGHQSHRTETAVITDFISSFNPKRLKALALWRYRGHRPQPGWTRLTQSWSHDRAHMAS
jgi:hypothetical protein